MSARPIGKRASFRLIRPAEKGGAGPHSILLGFLRWFCRPGGRLNLDCFSDHMLRDIGVDPKGREDSTTGFWRRR